MQLNGDLTERMLDTDWWSDEAVARTGMPVIDSPLVSVGGGIGSFTLVDLLRIAGVPASAVTVLTPNADPWQNYEYLTRVSQIPRNERLRSDSSGMPDNIWAFPSYAVVESWRERRLGPLLQVLVEPVFADYYTPRAEYVFKGMQREAERIGYADRVVRGLVHVVRRRHGGGYFALLGTRDGSSPRLVYRTRHLHLAVGYPGVKFLPDLQSYRERTGDQTRVVNAYEPHDHVYEDLRHRPGTVLVRGSGIATSRILQRLMEDRWSSRCADADRPPVPHLRERPARRDVVPATARRRRLGLPRLQLAEGGLGRPAQGHVRAARRPGAGGALPPARWARTHRRASCGRAQIRRARVRDGTRRCTARSSTSSRPDRRSA